jgi:hypothetical protein
MRGMEDGDECGDDGEGEGWRWVCMAMTIREEDGGRMVWIVTVAVR